MLSRERVRRALTFQRPDRTPRDLWHLPGISMYRRDELDAMLKRFHSDFGGVDVTFGRSERARGTPAVVGTYVDDWGCGWSVAEPGVVGEVKYPPLADWSALDHWRPPYEVLDRADFSRIDASYASSPKLWRGFYKPLYAEYCRIAHAAGKFVFFHSDGHIMEIYPDLIEIGVDAVNSQLFCMDIEEIGRRFKGQITFWGEIDRQNVLPFGTVDDVRAAVRRVRRALDDGRGGVIAQCEWGIGVKAEDVAAVFETWEE